VESFCDALVASETEQLVAAGDEASLRKALKRVSRKRLKGLEPSTFCMAIVCDFRINAWFCGFRLNRITGDYRGFGVLWSPNGHRGLR